MATTIDTATMNTTYDVLEALALGTVGKLFQAHSIDNQTKGVVMSQCVAKLLDLSVSSVSNQPLMDAQIATEKQKLISLKNDDVIKVATANKDIALKEQQRLMIDAQKVNEQQKVLKTVREIQGFDDQLRIKEAEMLSNVTAMYGAGGTTLISDLQTKMFDAVNAITPASVPANPAPVFEQEMNDVVLTVITQ